MIWIAMMFVPVTSPPEATDIEVSRERPGSCPVAVSAKLLHAGTVGAL